MHRHGAHRIIQPHTLQRDGGDGGVVLVMLEVMIMMMMPRMKMMSMMIACTQLRGHVSPTTVNKSFVRFDLITPES
jgi:hypothetical protein